MNQLSVSRRYKILTTRISMNSQRQFLLKRGNCKAQWLTVEEIESRYQNLNNLNEFREKFRKGFSIIPDNDQIDPFENLIQVQSNCYKFFDVNECIPTASICNCKNNNSSDCLNEGCENFSRGVECTPLCLMGDDCSNRHLQIINNEKDLDVFRTKQYNWGVITDIDFHKDDFIAEYKGIVQSCYDRTISQIYSMDLGRTSVIDASRWCNATRFLNHCCIPNAQSNLRAVDGLWRLAFFALRKIEANEEITIDYGKSYSQNAEICYCQAPNCAGIIGGKKEFEFNPNKWNEPSNEQTQFLKRFFAEKLWETIPI